ncbi:MAG TPA: O-antigen ligase family protein [Bryobacteraceae bacterium]|jgi:O-antigen ligase
MAASTPLSSFIRTGNAPANPLVAPPATGLGAAANNPLDNLAFRLTLIYIVMLVGRVPEITAHVFNTSFYQILIISTTLLALSIVTGKLIKVGTTRVGKMWIAFHLWVLLSLPFSGYRRGTFEFMQPVLLFYLAVFFLGGFLTLSIDTLRKGIWAMAWAGIIALGWMQFTGVADEADRFASSGSFSNANLVAIYIMCMIPFWGFILINNRYSWFTRMFFFGAIMLGLLSVLRTGSRSGLITIALLAVPMFVSMKLASKAKFIVVAVAATVAVLAWAPKTLKERWATLFDSQARNEVAASAMGSSDARYALLIESLEETAKHPFLGVGLGVYENVAANDKLSQGEKALWQVTHNMYTEISAETGIPGFVIYMSALYLSMMEAWRVRKATKFDPGMRELNLIAGAVLFAYLSFCFNGFFTSMATDFLMYILVGFSIAVGVVYQTVVNSKLPAPVPVHAESNQTPLGNSRFFPSKPILPKPVPALAGKTASTAPEVVDPNANAPWRRNPRKHPPQPGTPAR